MSSARLAALLFAAFVLLLVLVQWQRRSAFFPRVYDTRVTAARRGRPATLRRPADAPRPRPEATAALDVPDAGEPPAESPGAGASAEAIPPAPDPAAEAEARRRAEAVMERIERLLSREEREEPWATTTEEWIAATFGHVTGTQVDRNECKRTVCAVTARHASGPVAQRWIARISAGERGLRAMTLPTELGDGQTRTRTFLFDESGTRAAR